MKNSFFIKIKLILFSALLIGIMMSCKKDIEPNDELKSIYDLNISDNFNFATTENTTIKVTLLDNLNQPVAYCRVDVYDGQGQDDPNSSVEVKGKKLYSGLTNASGVFEAFISLPSYLDEIIISPVTVGLPAINRVAIVNGNVTTTLGGPSANRKSTETAGQLKSGSVVGYNYLGTWNNLGVPNYLTQPGDVLTASFLADVSASLPEYLPLTTSHPEYLESSAEGNLVLTDSCDVWVTFVHEGAGWKNSLGFYTFDSQNPPTSISQITNKTIIFPNTSFINSNGGLYAGDKVYIGSFAAGTEIGWFLVANGWSSTNYSVGNGTHSLYSDVEFNPEANVSLKKHQVLLYDAITDRIVIAFEDMRRDQSADNDFNDAIFFATANPIEAVQNNQIRILDSPNDADNDNVPDMVDDYPNDPARAFDNYYPAEGQYGTLAFEDLWPGMGDYDFNDLVLGYNYNQVTNAQNNVVEIKSNYKVNAIGASFRNGFGIQLGVTPSAVASVTGSNLTKGIINLSPNGVESGQSKAVCILFDDAYNILNYPGSSIGINTDPNAPYVTPEVITQQINFVTPVSTVLLGTPPYNPFIFIDGERGKEVHLPNSEPTSLVTNSYFGTSADDSNINAVRYYKTKGNLPWAINLPVEWDYPIEKAKVNLAYLKFNPWAESSGNSFPLWYQTQTLEYRNNSLIYQTPSK